MLGIQSAAAQGVGRHTGRGRVSVTRHHSRLRGVHLPPEGPHRAATAPQAYRKIRQKNPRPRHGCVGTSALAWKTAGRGVERRPPFIRFAREPRVRGAEVFGMRGHENVVDVIVIGGGPAGLAAALCLGRARRSVLVVDSGSPRHAVAEGVHNFLTRDGIPPSALRAVAWEQMRAYVSVSRSEGTVESLEQRDGRWIAAFDDGARWAADAVLLATGVIDQHPELRGYDALWGRSIFHCPYCHGWEVRDQPLAVLGQGPALAQYAPLLRSWSDDVVVCTNGAPVEPGAEQELSAYGLGIRTAPIAQLEAKDGTLVAIRFDDGTRLARHTLFVVPSPRLPGLVADLRLDLDERGYVRVDEDGATSAEALWAAGDLTSRRHQVMEAAAQGLRAAMSINRRLVFGGVPR
jgi:thioredoxin reductase